MGEHLDSNGAVKFASRDWIWIVLAFGGMTAAFFQGMDAMEQRIMVRVEQLRVESKSSDTQRLDRQLEKMDERISKLESD